MSKFILSKTVINYSVLNYVSRVPSCPTCLACLRAFASYFPSFFYLLYALSFFLSAFSFITCFTCPHFLRALRTFTFKCLQFSTCLTYLHFFYKMLNADTFINWLIRANFYVLRQGVLYVDEWCASFRILYFFFKTLTILL